METGEQKCGSVGKIQLLNLGLTGLNKIIGVIGVSQNIMRCVHSTNLIPSHTRTHAHTHTHKMKPVEMGVSHVPQPDEFAARRSYIAMAPVVPASSDCALPAGDWDPCCAHDCRPALVGLVAEERFQLQRQSCFLTTDHYSKHLKTQDSFVDQENIDKWQLPGVQFAAWHHHYTTALQLVAQTISLLSHLIKFGDRRQPSMFGHS